MMVLLMMLMQIQMILVIIIIEKINSRMRNSFMILKRIKNNDGMNIIHF